MQKERFWSWGILALCLVGAIFGPVLATSAPTVIENCPTGVEIDLLDPTGAGTALDSPETQPDSKDPHPVVSGKNAASDPTESPAVLTTLDREFSFVDGSRPGYRIPDGSRIRYCRGYTEIYGPTGALFGNVSDDHAADWFIPGGKSSTPARCTHSVEVPNGSHIFHGDGVDSVCRTDNGSNPFVTLVYAIPDPGSFTPAQRGEEQWVADFSKPISPDIKSVKATWQVAKSPRWQDIVAGTIDGGKSKSDAWQFAIFNGIETRSSYQNGHWCGILQPVLHWNAVETSDAQIQGTGQNQQIANQGVTGAAPGTDRQGCWAIASHSVGGNGNVDTHTPLQYTGVDRTSVTGTVERYRNGWDITTSSAGGALAHLYTHDLNPSTHANNLEAVLTLERHSGFNTDFQTVPQRWPGTVTFSNVAITGGDQTAGGAGPWNPVRVQPLFKIEYDKDGEQQVIKLITEGTRARFLQSQRVGANSFGILTPNS